VKIRAAGCLLALALALSACEKVPMAPAKVAGAEEPANLTFQGFKIRSSHDGKMVWEAEAVRAKVFQQVNKAQAEEVTLTYFQNGRKVSQVWADHADMNLKDHDVKARGHVIVKGRNGVVLTTSQLDWDNETQQATSPAQVTVKRHGTTVTGWGMRADRSLNDVQILSNVQAEADNMDDLRHAGDGLRP